MKCAIEGCGLERGEGRLVLCDGHATAWISSGEYSRASQIPFDLTTGATGDQRRDVAVGDFIRRTSAEERNSR